MYKIRKNVFETNSSSTHSLVLSKKDRGWNFDLPVDEDGVLTVKFGEFGWGPQVLSTPMEKLSYLITDRGPTYEDGYFEELIEESDELQKIVNIIKEQCPYVKEVWFEPNDDDYYRFGYVDHESDGTSYGMSIKELVFSNDVIILIDNDNSNHYKDYFEGWNGKPAKKDIEELFK